jgi:hypothetical protein
MSAKQWSKMSEVLQVVEPYLNEGNQPLFDSHNRSLLLALSVLISTCRPAGGIELMLLPLLLT